MVATFALVASGITCWAGNYQEWWSLDPDGDGTRDGDAPIVRVLRDEGWSDKGVAVVDIDGDYGVDRIEWNPVPGEVWCIVVPRDPNIVVPDWPRGEPLPCQRSGVSLGATP